MNYPRLIKRLRASLFLSQTDLAEILGTNKVSVSRWENGKFIPSNKYKKELYVLFKKHISEEINSHV
ncbi:MAG: helix-turn-helix domain-containing protein [Bacilli bacterium]|nr:helix-turn-helix domain-containing protein [Bacilli bacterium]